MGSVEAPVYHSASRLPAESGVEQQGQTLQRTAVQFLIDIENNKRGEILSKLAKPCPAPGVATEYNAYRQGPSAESRSLFQQCMLGALRGVWKNEESVNQFLHLVDLLDTEGCAIFTGLLDLAGFETLVGEFDKAMRATGCGAFLHSYMNLADHAEFLRDVRFNNAFAHPLLIALMAYSMGGPVGMTDVRGKDTPPISVNAQDNMLHIDNSPFRQEFKVLLCWERGAANGPDGQNFVFLPGTHKGNRHVRHNADGTPWSTENDSIFLTNDAIDGLFEFQQESAGRPPTVIEVRYPERPISVLFSAASLVHHRYRTDYGNSRSCIIAAFHLASENNGSVVSESIPEDSSSLSGAVTGSRSSLTCSNFISLLVRDAATIESKLNSLFAATTQDDNTSASVLDTSSLALDSERIARWRKTVTTSPSSSAVKLSSNVRLATRDTHLLRAEILQKIKDVMVYDKHGLLDLILYQDGREEIRKSARKLIWSMVPDQITAGLTAWIGDDCHLPKDFFCISVDHILEPQTLKANTDILAEMIGTRLQNASEASGDRGHLDQVFLARSFHQLLIDLAESIVRCEKVETYISTNLFIFWTIHHLLPVLDAETTRLAIKTGLEYLQCYMASNLLVESN